MTDFKKIADDDDNDKENTVETVHNRIYFYADINSENIFKLNKALALLEFKVVHPFFSTLPP
jgi:hypothetical protein